MLASIQPTQPQYLPHYQPQPIKNEQPCLEWQSETLEGKYIGEVALFFQDQKAVHCEALDTGHWQIWRYRGDSTEVLQKGQLKDVQSAQAACERVMLSLFPTKNSAVSHSVMPSVPNPMIANPMTANPMTANPMMMPHYYDVSGYDDTDLYQDEDTLPEERVDSNHLRHNMRIWALLTTFLGALLLTLWYGFLYEPAKTTTIVACVIMLSWGGMALRRWLEETFSHSSLRATVLSQHNG